MPGSKAPPSTRAGRPRRFEAQDELRLLLDAALAVMERNGYVDAAVADILREADLSTRSFYRHFESKDQLLCALYRREAEAAAMRLQAKVQAAPNPRAALDAWIDEILSFGHHRAKAARVAVLTGTGLYVLDRRAKGAKSNQAIAPILDAVSPNTLTSALLLAAGIVLVLGERAGLYVLVAPVLAAFVGGIASTWLFLIKITE